MSVQPLFSPPTQLSTGTRTSSRNTWFTLWSTSRSSGDTVIPGVSIGRMINEMPWCFFTSGLVRTASQQ